MTTSLCAKIGLSWSNFDFKAERSHHPPLNFWKDFMERNTPYFYPYDFCVLISPQRVDESAGLS